MDTILSGGFNDDLLKLANQKATQLKRDRVALFERMEDIKARGSNSEVAVNPAMTWKTADYNRK